MAIEAEPKAPADPKEGATASKGSAPTPPAGAQLGGARADFVASLGRKIADVRALLATLDADLRARGPRDELRRRLHALGAGARMLRFEAMATQLAEGTGVLDRVSKEGKASPADMGALSRMLDDLPALAWGDAADASSAPEAASSAAALPGAPLSALVVGAEAIAEALTEDGESVFFECERTERPAGALDLARALAPDLVVIDGDLEGALALVESLLDDPLTEPVPILVLGDFRSPDKASRFVALGVAKTLPKPVSPATLQRACQEVADQRAEGRTVRVVLGEPTVEQLADRLAEEVRRALVGSLDSTERRARVALGEGTEVLGAVWGAIARVREVITMRTDGGVRYVGGGPEGAVAMASWLQQEVAGLDRGPRGRGAAADVSLERAVVVVADDDPGVTWFIADLLRGAGCIVHEALDGRRALALAYEHSPQLVISDILMPGLDGFGLCRALKRDVALRDVPVILLSWKEDLLQRVRELGAPAAGYLRKESDARAIVARVREVLRPRARIEARLQGDGEVRGRLDDLSVHSLLELVCVLRPSSRVSVRDASFLYEVEVRDGSPRRATRTAGDGSFRRGERVIASMLGVGAGRFIVTPSRAAVAGDLTGGLSEQLARPLRLAREAMGATTGTRMANVDRLVLDEEAVAGYLLATPQPARDVIKKIAEGGSPRAMLVKGEVAPTLLEDVLVDLAARGAIMAARGPLGDDLLDPSVDRDLDPKRAPTFTPTPVAETVIQPASSAKSQARPSAEDALVDAMGDEPEASAPKSSVPVPMVDAKLVAAAAVPKVDAKVVAAAAVAPAVAVADEAPKAPAPPVETSPEERSSPVVAKAAPAAEAKAAPAAETSIPVAVETLEPTRSAELSKTAPSRERARRTAAAAARTASSPAEPVALAPREGRGRGVLAMLVVLVAGAAGTYWCSMQAAPREPEPSSNRP